MTTRRYWLVSDGFNGERIYTSPDLTYGSRLMVVADPVDRDGAAVRLVVGNLSVDLTALEADELKDWLGMALEALALPIQEMDLDT